MLPKVRNERNLLTNEDVTLHAQPNLYRIRVRRLLEKGGNKTFSRIEKIVSGGKRA